MSPTSHWAVFIDNTSEKGHLIDMLLGGDYPAYFKSLENQKGALFSQLALERFMDEEDRHGTKVLTASTGQFLRSMSSGERKKALLRHILNGNPDFLVLDNPFDNLDRDTQAELKIRLEKVSKEISIVQLLGRKTDLLPFIHHFVRLDGHELIFPKMGKAFNDHPETNSVTRKQRTLSEMWKPSTDHPKVKNFDGGIPPPLQPMVFEDGSLEEDILITLKAVNVSYGDKPILKNIVWTIRKGEFWELRGNNGSGKTTILSMITGENPKGYGQELYIFGRKKGSGESVWDIKKKIGYFTPAMTDRFTGYHSVEHMMISGLNDSIGLYVKPTEVQLRLAKEWVRLIGLYQLKDQLFHDLSMGHKRLVMCARAMIKHPPLLILDEPTAGLDDGSAALLVALVNTFAEESDTTVIFVSHRDEPGLEPKHVYELQMTDSGSVGHSVKR